jgi:hypothetical protein
VMWRLLQARGFARVRGFHLIPENVNIAASRSYAHNIQVLEFLEVAC